MCLANQKIYQRIYYELPNSAFLRLNQNICQPQNPEFRINPENFHQWTYTLDLILFKFKRLMWYQKILVIKAGAAKIKIQKNMWVGPE